MTSSEFHDWWTDVTTRWPSVSAWLARSFPEATQQRSMLKTWLEVLASASLSDCLEINRQMQAGELAWVGEYDADKERLPQHVRRLARQLSYENREQPQAEPDTDLKPASFPAGKILRRILELTDKGTPVDEAKALVLKELPVGRPNWEPRYHCTICLDVGMVTVASPTAIRMALAEKFHECHHREAALRCSCRGYLAANPKRPILIYDADRDYRITDFLWREPEVLRFHAWCEDQRNAFWNSKRHSEFDSFNQREFAP